MISADRLEESMFIYNSNHPTKSKMKSENVTPTKFIGGVNWSYNLFELPFNDVPMKCLNRGVVPFIL